MSKRAYLTDVLLNGLVIYASYVMAVVVRYRILRSEPGIDALSAPYLLIALIYSILIAFTFDYEEPPRWLSSRTSIHSLYQILSKNAIGCLMLLSAFYFTGIVYFSRWALFLFWLISSVGLILKREILYSRISRKRAGGTDPYNVLLIGNGEMTKDYIQSVIQNPQFGIRIEGYLGNGDQLATDMEAVFDAQDLTEPVITWLGEYTEERFQKIIEERHIQEVIITDHEMPSEIVSGILSKALKRGILTNMSMHYSELIRNDTRIRDLGTAKTVMLNDREKEKTFYPSGIVITAAMLFLMMIIKRFSMGAIDTMKGFESYRCVIFALFGFFLFLSMTQIFVNQKHATLKRCAVTWGICVLFILAFEFFYSPMALQNIQIDIIVMTVVLVICLVIAGFVEAVEQSDFIMMD